MNTIQTNFNFFLWILNEIYIFSISAAILYILIEYMLYKGYKLPNWIQNFLNFILDIYRKIIFFIFFKFTICFTYIFNNLNKLKYKFKNFCLKIFIKKQIIKLSFKRKFKDLNFRREFNLLPHKLYFYFNNLGIEIEIDKSINSQLGIHSIYILAHNIYGLLHHDLFRACYVELLTRPEIYNILRGQFISLIGVGYTNPETLITNRIEIHPYIYINEYSTFNEFYTQIISYCKNNGNIKDLDKIYRLEIHIRNS
jgi:hypothetical protein